RIVDIGADHDVLEAAGPGAEVVDLRGGLMSPGFGDSHVHPVIAGLQLGQCSLDHYESADECLAAIAAYAAKHPELPWIVGGGWSLAQFPGGAPHRSVLDRIVPDRPVFLRERGFHGAWVNSRALELAGITAETSDPADGRIKHDADGEPSGMLHEGAAYLVTRVAPPMDRAALYDGLMRGQEHCLSLGVTQWQDALLRLFDAGGADGLDPYADALERGTLLARVTGALWWDRDRGLDQIDDLLVRGARLSGHEARFRANAVKIMVDGVAENLTASLSRPYRDSCGHETDNFGISFLDREVLKEVVAAVDALGLQAHFHALGDQAVTDALDAVEHARKSNPGSRARHTLAHLQMVRPADVPRFAELDAVANLQPLWARSEPKMDERTMPFIDPQLAEWQYPFMDLHSAGARLAAGSDWPVSSADPLEGMHVAVTRTAEHSPADTEPFLPEQRLPLGIIWDAYTSGVAFLNEREDQVGTIRPGMLADLVVLDRNPFTEPAHEIAETRVESTWIDGRCVYHRA
ncbi:MAG: amidohydrolase, partial [Nocardioides sp.]|uniref:amidohydrolase n=1 Tax=Nocardioides sp. TaxID=35761 RepID=UPI00326306ED